MTTLLRLCAVLPALLLSACVSVKLPPGVVGDTAKTAKGLVVDTYDAAKSAYRDWTSPDVQPEAPVAPNAAQPQASVDAAVSPGAGAVPMTAHPATRRVHTAIYFAKATESISASTDACIANARREAALHYGRPAGTARVLSSALSWRDSQPVLSCTIELAE